MIAGSPDDADELAKESSVTQCFNPMMFVVARGPESLLDGETLRMMELDCLLSLELVLETMEPLWKYHLLASHRPFDLDGYGATQAPPENRAMFFW